MIKLEFSPDEKGEKHYTTCFLAIVQTQKQLALTEWDDVIALIRKLKDVGVDTGTTALGQSIYELHEAGGVIFLERAEFKQLVDFLKQPIWRPAALEDVKSTIAWLEESKKASKEGSKADKPSSDSEAGE